MKNILILILIFLSGHFDFAQEQEIEIKLSGRIIVDVGFFKSDNYEDMFNDGISIQDSRIGFKSKYGKWKGVFEVGYALSNVNPKDIYIEYDFDDNNVVKVGHFYHQFGWQSVSSSMDRFLDEESMTKRIFYNSRQIGGMFIHKKDNFYGTFSVFAEKEAMKISADQLGKEGYGIMSRMVYSPLQDDGKIFQIGISGAVETPQYNTDSEKNHQSFSLKSYFPEKISKVEAHKADIDKAKMLYKFTPEIVAAWGRIGFVSQYYSLNILRENNFENYKADGGYILLRGLLGEENTYQYSHEDAGLKKPKAGSKELTMGYSHINMSDYKSGIIGGSSDNFWVGFNYYLNKYMIWNSKLSMTQIRDSELIKDTNLKLIETRFIMKF